MIIILKLRAKSQLTRLKDSIPYSSDVIKFLKSIMESECFLWDFQMYLSSVGLPKSLSIYVYLSFHLVLEDKHFFHVLFVFIININSSIYV